MRVKELMREFIAGPLLQMQACQKTFLLEREETKVYHIALAILKQDYEQRFSQ